MSLSTGRQATAERPPTTPGAADAPLRAALTFGNPAAETEEDSGALFWLLQDAPEQKLVITTIGQWLTAYVVRRCSPGGGGDPHVGDNKTGMGHVGTAGNEAVIDVTARSDEHEDGSGAAGVVLVGDENVEWSLWNGAHQTQLFE